MKEETNRTGSWKQDSFLGRTVDFELYAPYLWNDIPIGNPAPLEGPAPGLLPRLSVAWNNLLIICVTE